MELIIAAVVVLIQMVRVLVKEREAAAAEKTKPLCHDCTSAHLQVDGKGRTTVFCTFGGGVRPVKAEVVFCTDFRNRYVPVRPVPVGFVPAIRLVELEAEAAITQG